MTNRPFPFRTASRWTALAAAAIALQFVAPLLAATPEYMSLAGVKAEGFQKWLDDARSQGYVPMYVNGYDAGGHAEFSGVAVKDEKGRNFESKYDLTSEDFQKINGQMSKRDRHLYCLTSYLDGKSPRFAAVWVDDAAYGKAMKFRHGMTADQYRETAETMKKRDLEPVMVTAYTDPDDGKVRLSAGFYHGGGRDWDIHFDMTTDQYSDVVDKWKSMGFRARYVSVYDTPDGPRFLATGIKEKDPASKVAYWGTERHGMSGPQYQKEFDKQAADGFIPSCICGYREGGEVRFAAIWQKRKN